MNSGVGQIFWLEEFNSFVWNIYIMLYPTTAINETWILFSFLVWHALLLGTKLEARCDDSPQKMKFCHLLTLISFQTMKRQLRYLGGILAELSFLVNYPLNNYNLSL